MNEIKCYLITPVYGAPLQDEICSRNMWPPYNTIVGWVRLDTGERKEHNFEWGVGAMWFATWSWRGREWSNEVEPPLHVRCPEHHDWNIDSRASNCTMLDDRLHRCWIRHGEVPNITVDKNGLTCAAGAGSIMLPKWHGFLRNGQLVSV